jgi:hypothetical protein
MAAAAASFMERSAHARVSAAPDYVMESLNEFR